MKKFICFAAIFACVSFKSIAQDYVKLDYTPIEKPSSFYLGFGGGLNNYLGLIGPSVEYQVVKNFTVYGGVGLGSWGNKASIGVRLYPNYPGNWAFGAGISHSAGLDHLETEMPEGTVFGYSQPVVVPFKLKSANTFNLSFLKFWMIGQQKKNRLNIELGYAIPFEEKRYEVKNSDYQLTRDGIYFMNILQPGGLNLGVGLSFGMN